MTLLLNFCWFKTFKSKLHSVKHIPKLINNSSSLNKGNYYNNGVCILISTDFCDFISPYSISLVLVPTKKISFTRYSVRSHFQTPRTSSKILRSAWYIQLPSFARRKCGQKQSSVFDALH